MAGGGGWWVVGGGGCCLVVVGGGGWFWVVVDVGWGWWVVVVGGGAAANARDDEHGGIYTYKRDPGHARLGWFLWHVADSGIRTVGKIQTKPKEPTTPKNLKQHLGTPGIRCPNFQEFREIVALVLLVLLVLLVVFPTAYSGVGWKPQNQRQRARPGSLVYVLSYCHS